VRSKLSTLFLDTMSDLLPLFELTRVHIENVTLWGLPGPLHWPFVGLKCCSSKKPMCVSSLQILFPHKAFPGCPLELSSLCHLCCFVCLHGIYQPPLLVVYYLSFQIDDKFQAARFIFYIVDTIPKDQTVAGI
jgi:hypothetical protein